jgi:Tol biopolymer transport system component
LVAGSPGVWTVTADGAKRRLGGWSDAAWSPRGRYIAVAARGELIAVNRAGLVQWRLARPDVHSPRWFSPDGYRVAYLSGSSLRVLAGDGTGDRRVATGVAAAPAAWRPAHAYQLAYAQIDRTVVIRDADSGRLAWSREVPGIPTQLSWSYNGARLLVLTTQAAFVFDGGGRRLARIPALGRRPDLEGAFSPDGRRLALLSDRQLTLSDATSASAVRRRVFTGAGLRGLAWSPNGRWLLFGWPAADQWVFLSATGRPRIVAVSRIAEQFGRPRSRPGFPSLEGWCCGVGAG